MSKKKTQKAKKAQKAGVIDEGTLRSRVDTEVVHLRDEIKRVEREYEKYKREHGSLQAKFRAIGEAIRPIPPLPVEYRYRGGKRVASTCAAVMRISDTHHGMVQYPDEIEGFNAYGPLISYQRQLGYAKVFVDWVELHRHGHTIPNCHVIVTADLISGDIHDELKITNAWPSPVQAIRSAEVLAHQIACVAPHFEKVIVEFLVEDNHARLTKKPQAKEAGLNSHNYVVGFHAKALVRDHKNVTFNIYPKYQQVIPVLTRRYLLCHGHGIKGWAGIPWYGIQRKVGREAEARLQIIMEEASKADKLGFHKYLFGHFHTSVDLPLYDCCPAVTGTDAYDHAAGRHGKPGQVSWLVHPKHGEFDRITWDLRQFDGDAQPEDEPDYAEDPT